MSGLRPIAQVETLPHGEKMALLAELTAICLNMREPKDTRDPGRRPAPSSAEIAALYGANVSARWTPDGRTPPSSKLSATGMLDEMALRGRSDQGLKKTDLVGFVAGRPPGGGGRRRC